MGRRRLPKTRDTVAARIGRELARLKPKVVEGVQPLNTGFFNLEAIRHNTVAKAKGTARPAIKEQ